MLMLQMMKGRSREVMRPSDGLRAQSEVGIVLTRTVFADPVLHYRGQTTHRLGDGFLPHCYLLSGNSPNLPSRSQRCQQRRRASHNYSNHATERDLGIRCHKTMRNPGISECGILSNYARMAWKLTTWKGMSVHAQQICDICLREVNPHTQDIHGFKWHLQVLICVPPELD